MRSSHNFSRSESGAAEVMRNHFVSVETTLGILRKTHVRFTSQERLELREIPFRARELMDVQLTHLLFPGIPLTIFEMHRCAHPDCFAVPFERASREYDGLSYAESERIKIEWYLLRIVSPGLQPPDRSSFDNQMGLLNSRVEEIPAANVLVLARLLVWALLSRRIFNPHPAWSSATLESKNRVRWRVAVGSTSSDPRLHLLKVDTHAEAQPPLIYSRLKPSA